MAPSRLPTSRASIGTPASPTSLPLHLPGPAVLLHPPAATRAEGVAVRVRHCEADRDQMRCDLCRARGLQAGSGVAEASASTSSGTGSNNRDDAGRKRTPTPCSPSNAASKTAAGPKSPIGECPARLHDQKYGMRPSRSSRSHAAGSRRFAETAESRRCLNSYAGRAKSNPFSSGRRIGACRSANSLQLAA